MRPVPINVALLILPLLIPMTAEAKERAAFLAGQYATAEQCAKLRKIEGGEPRNVSTAAELLDADGFHNWEGGCEFTKVFEHDPGESWTAIMVCTNGAMTAPALYHFAKDATADRFEVAGSEDDEPGLYLRCDPGKGK